MKVYWLVCFYKEGKGGTFAFSSREIALEYRRKNCRKIDYYFLYAYDEIENNAVAFDDYLIQ